MEDLILKKLTLGSDNIYGYNFVNIDQKEEIELRKNVAEISYDNYLDMIAKSHSIPVMDYEVDEFLKNIPRNGKIIDIGGGWGWHWRNIRSLRPDIKIYIVDFIRGNLEHAKNILSELINKNIFLIHGDATNLIFDNNSFDGYWTVQTLQHIPNFELVINEAYRVLNKGSVMVNYSLNNQSFIKFIYEILGKYYHIEGYIPNTFYLSRASKKQLDIIKMIFENKPKVRYSEILYKPELKISFTGNKKSIFGFIDKYLSNEIGIFSSIARQKSFHVIK